MHKVSISRWSIFWGLSLFVFVSCFGWIVFSYGHKSESRLLKNVEEWPLPIQKLDDLLGATDPDRGHLQVVLLEGDPPSIMSSVICRMAYDDRYWETIERHLELESVGDRFANQWTSEIRKRVDISWWPSEKSETKNYASKRLLNGDEGDLYVIAVDSDSGMIFIYYEFNF